MLTRSCLLGLALSVSLGVLGSTGCSAGVNGSGGGGGGGGSSSGGGSCTNISGTWTVSGDCGADTCVVTQAECSTNFACGGGSASYSGTVAGDSVSYAGRNAAGVQGTCQGTVNGRTMSGTCMQQGSAATCSFAASLD